MNAWLTPETADETTREITIRVTNDEYLFACLLGAVLALIGPENWEAVGSVTPELAASLFDPTFEDLANNA